MSIKKRFYHYRTGRNNTAVELQLKFQVPAPTQCIKKFCLQHLDVFRFRLQTDVVHRKLQPL